MKQQANKTSLKEDKIKVRVGVVQQRGPDRNIS